MLVSFAPGKAKLALDALKNAVGLETAEVAFVEDFTAKPSSSWFRPALANDELGLAAVSPTLFDLARLGIGLPGPVISVRPEYFLRRPRTLRTRASNPIDAVKTVAPFDAVETQSWVLTELGVTSMTHDGNGVTVALLDSGVHHPHADLKHAIDVQRSVSFVPGKSALEDELGHGTHCAGLIAGAAKPTTGTRYGVAPGVRLMSVRVFDSFDRTPELDLMNAVRWAVKKGAKILSLSAGRDAGSSSFPEDIALGQYLIANDVLLLAAAGNESNRQQHVIVASNSPGNAGGIPSVGAMTHARRVWNDSNGKAGPLATMVDFVAPGVAIESADPDGTVTAATGTSVATPIAAGVAAVLLGTQPQNVASLLTQMKAVARQLPAEPQPGVGAGLVRVA